MSQPLITYALFCYNHEAWVREALAGALAQDYSPLEIIISDDCSTDNTFAVIKEVAAAYAGPHHLVLNRNPSNQGIGTHVNTVFGLARGEWIVTGASDDISDPGRCSRIVELAREHPRAGAIGLGWRDLNEDGSITASVMEHRYRESRTLRAGSKDWIDSLFRGELCVGGMSAAWRNEMVKAVPPLPHSVWQEDEVYSFWAGWLGYSILFRPEPLITYRRHLQSISNVLHLADAQAREARTMYRGAGSREAYGFLLDQTIVTGAGEDACLTPRDIAAIRKLLRRKWQFSKLVADWWDRPAVARLLGSSRCAEGRALIKNRAQWPRFLPKAIFDWWIRRSDR